MGPVLLLNLTILKKMSYKLFLLILLKSNSSLIFCLSPRTIKRLFLHKLNLL
ncbi:hypothetical protein Patl1_16721 [Pistacia atlantica]|uniref:Uncharacterized protein n=1 Tax=Pistacia atlantica TaxID=434234 RepID=A0ACC1B828_9ROSI|nr:hypothetical protein Patl1_16721 [Pistacia atlantica]